MIPGQIQVFRDEQILDVMTVTHGLWFHRKCWHPDEWSELATAAAQIARFNKSFAGSEKSSSGNRSVPDSDKMLLLIEKILKRFPDHFKEVSVPEIKKISGNTKFHLRVSINQSDYLLFLSLKDTVKDSLFQTGNFAITYSRDTPLTSQRHQKIIFNLVKVLDRLVARHAPELLDGRSNREAEEINRESPSI
ncbi:MAG: hypothetical protein FJ088_11600 [Deltaproteobacteria bacterium]|nr:hypothetical protein [Deltaproteobacteria bacterium]